MAVIDGDTSLPGTSLGKAGVGSKLIIRFDRLYTITFLRIMALVHGCYKTLSITFGEKQVVQVNIILCNFV